jgi:hypothetical protein
VRYDSVAFSTDGKKNKLKRRKWLMVSIACSSEGNKKTTPTTGEEIMGDG